MLPDPLLTPSPDPGRGISASRRAARWLAAAALVLGNFFLHKPISDVCDALYARIGRGPYELVTFLAVAALSLGGAALLLRWGGRASLRSLMTGLIAPRRLAALAAILAGMATAQQWLLVSNVELIHFPQFGLLAALLLAAGLSPQSAWLSATAGGALDELYQRLVIYKAVPNVYFDWNDIVLNALGAALAVVLAASFTASPPSRWSRRLFAAALIVFAAALWVAPPRVTAVPSFPYWHPTLGHALTGRDYHVMAASEGIGALLIIWGLVALGATSSPPFEKGGSGGISSDGDKSPLAPLLRGGVLLAVLLLAGCVPRRTPAPVAVPSRPFIVTFWCGPPLDQLTDARAAEIAAADFTVVGAPCEGARDGALNRRALDTAARHGLKLWITDPRVDQYYDLHPQWAARLDDAVAEYGGHPALDGYFLVDEPSADKFVDLAAVVEHLQRSDPQRVPYINLLPDYAAPDAFGTTTYREHVERFMAVVQPPLLSFDYYPFKTDGDRGTYFDNLALVREVALRAGIPFVAIVQAMPHGPYRDPTEAELAWQVHHALAFGARGISYFAYWTPVDVEGADKWHFRHGLVEAGVPTEHFWQAARLNAATRAIADQLDGWRSLAVVDTQGRFGSALPIGPLRAIDGGPVTVGLFGDCHGRTAALVVNQDYRAPETVRLVLSAGAAPPERFDLTARSWQQPGDQFVALAPGGAALLRWPPP